jgi:diacylglycerol kinase family enzyme
VSLIRRAEALAERATPGPGPRRRVLVVVNPHASAVSPRLEAAVVQALGSSYAVDAVATERPGHALELGHAAAREGYDLVVPFGGDGTVNEVANALAGTRTPLTPLPGGTTNVFGRALGVPRDPVAATEHLLGLAGAIVPRRVDLGRVNGRHFVFASGVGLSASVVRSVDARPRRKARLREWYFAWRAVHAFARRYAAGAAEVLVEAEGRGVSGVTVVVQNADPFTFFGARPIRVCPGAGLETGTLAFAVLRDAELLQLLTLAPRLFAARPASVARHPQVRALRPVTRARVSSATGAPFPLEADGDYLGDELEAVYEVAPGALWVVA